MSVPQILHHATSTWTCPGGGTGGSGTSSTAPLRTPYIWIAEVVEREFGVNYHRDHVGRLVHSLDWTHQKPETRAVERDEEALERSWPHSGSSPSLWAGRHVLGHLHGPAIVLLDNSQTHKGEPLHELQRQHPRLHIEHFPPYAPELNPEEGVWSLAKRKVANGRPNDVPELMDDVIRSFESI